MPIEFNVNPYNDDFEADNGPRENNYMRILFKPGYAVQARELTQLQTAIQNQIKLFGNHIFQDGSQVTGGHLTLDTKTISIKLENQFANSDVDVSDFLDKLITNDVGLSTKKAKVIAVDDTQQNKTLMLRYIRGGTFNDSEIIKVVPGDVPKARLISTNSANVGSVISINEGVFYVNGFFVHVPEQTIVLDPYSDSPTYRVGLEIDESIIDDSADSSLLDPAQDSFNYQAPGADRYQFSLVLAKRTLDSVDDNSFFELLRVENGVVTKQVKYPVYSEIEKTLARRTFDESGNYSVYPFRAFPVDHQSDDSKFIINVEAGKAYVKGFEFETIGTTPIVTNKARTTEQVLDYNLSLEFGNYITVNNLYGGNNGIFNVNQFESLDMHLVPTANINTHSSIEYTKTLIGTAKSKSLQKNSTDKYDLFIVDENLLTNTFTISSATASTFTFPSTYPNTPEGLYNGVSFTITAGTGINQQRRIVSYNSSRVATIDRDFDTIPDGTSQVTLNYGIKDVDSIVVRPTVYAANVYGGQNPAFATYASMDVDSFSKSSEGETFLSRTSFDRLLYVLPETAVADNFSNVDFYNRRYIPNALFSGGSYAINLTTGFSGKEEFYYGPTSGLPALISNSAVDENLLVIVRDKGSSAFANGEILSLHSAVTKTSNKLITITKGSSTFRADIFVNLKIVDASSTTSLVRAKTLKGNRPSISSVNYNNATETVTGQTDTKIDAGNGVVWFTNTNDIIKTPGNRQSLFISDVVRINKIYDSANALQIPSATNAIDITDHYFFDTGQRDNYYDHGSIILKDGKSPPTGQTAVLLTYFKHEAVPGDRGFFNRSSYQSADIANNFVAVYSSSSIGVTNLADAIDFRPRRIDATTATTFSDVLLPYTNLPMELDYEYYLPRIDKLVATSNKTFKILFGVPAKYPKAPADLKDTMTLYTIFVPPYTRKAKDVKFKFHENRRYTMRDIGIIDKRVQRLEYYTQLSLLEQQARAEKYLYEDRILEKEKYGILVEQFDGFNITDSKNPDLLCHISFNELKPYKKITPVALHYSSNTGPVNFNSKTFSLTYTEKELVVQNTATKAVVIQPHLFGTFNGTVVLVPEADTFISTTIRSEVTSTEVTDTANPPPGNTVEATTQEQAEDTEEQQASPQTQTTASDSTVQEAASTATVAQTGDEVTETGYDTTLFDEVEEQSEVVTTAETVDAQVDIGEIYIGNEGGNMGSHAYQSPTQYVYTTVSGSSTDAAQVQVYGIRLNYNFGPLRGYI